MRLIDADRIKYEQNEDYKDDYTGKTYQYSYVRKENIDKMPTVYAELVRYAFWEFKEDRLIVDGKDWVCSNCRKAQRYKENYCPNCGARMVENTV